MTTRLWARTAKAALVLAVVALVAYGFDVTASPSDGPIDWELIDPDPVGEGGPYEVVAWGDGYVGVGGGDSWTSPDGRTWQAAPLPDVGDGGATGLVAVSGGLVAVGSVSMSGTGWSTQAAVWTSVDGLQWQRIPGDPDLEPAPGYRSTQLSRVTAGPAGLVAAGTEWGDDGQHVMVWRSADGEDWLRATAPPYGSGPQDLLATVDGYVLAAGAGEMHAVFSYSTDGLDWTVAPDDPSFASAQPAGLAMLDGTIVAVGLRMTPVGFAPTVWVSTDGRAWTPVPDAPALSWWPFPEPTPVTDQGVLQGSAILAVHPAWSGFLAVGSHWGLDPSDPQPDGTYAAAIRGGMWWSADGQEWELLPDELVSFSVVDFSTLRYGLVNVTGLDGRPLIVGTTPEMGLTLWLGPISTG